ncbi:cytochrome P450 [Aspergillus heterothallicus]
MLACALAVALALVVLHLLYTHSRVKSIPGPFLARFPGLWRFHVQASPEYGQRLAELHRMYGDVVLLGPNLVSIRDHEEIGCVYRKKLLQEMIRSDQVSSQELPRLREEFSRFEGAINGELRNIIGTIRRHKFLDLTASLRFFSEEFLSRLFAGELSRPFTGNASDARRKSSFLSIIEEQLLAGPASLLKRERLSCYTFGRETSAASAFDVIEIRDGPLHHDRDEPLVLPACIRTVTTTFVAIFHLLRSNPTIYYMLRHELDSSPCLWDRSKFPSWRVLTGLRYLDAVFKETMRYALIMDSENGILLTNNSLAISGLHVPSGFAVSWHPFVVLCDRSIYGDDVQAFRPDRWLIAGHHQLTSMNKGLIPFNSCITQYPKLQSAWLELKKAVVVLLREFDLQVLENKTPEELGSLGTSPSALVRCTRRAPRSGYP